MCCVETRHPRTRHNCVSITNSIDHRLFRRLKNHFRWVVPYAVRRRLSFEEPTTSEDTLSSRRRWRRFKNLHACIECAYHKRPGGKAEGQLHISATDPTPFRTLHILTTCHGFSGWDCSWRIFTSPKGIRVNSKWPSWVSNAVNFWHSGWTRILTFRRYSLPTRKSSPLYTWPSTHDFGRYLFITVDCVSSANLLDEIGFVAMGTAIFFANFLPISEMYKPIDERNRRYWKLTKVDSFFVLLLTIDKVYSFRPCRATLWCFMTKSMAFVTFLDAQKLLLLLCIISRWWLSMTFLSLSLSAGFCWCWWLFCSLRFDDPGYRHRRLLSLFVEKIFWNVGPRGSSVDKILPFPRCFLSLGQEFLPSTSAVIV